MSLPDFSMRNVITRGDTNIVASDSPTVGDGSLYVHNRTVIYGTDVSSTPVTGALLVAGGAGIGGSANIGANLSIAGSSALAGTLSVGGNTTLSGIVNLTDTTNSSASTGGSLDLAGGMRIAKDLFVSGNEVITGSLTVNDALIFTSTEDATSTTTGALRVAGGAGIAKSLWVGGITHIVNETNSTSPTSGALQVIGGVGIGGDTYTAGSIHATGLVRVDSPTNAGFVLNFNSDDSGTERGYFEVYRDDVLQSSLIVNEAVAGLPLEINSDVTNSVTLVRGGGNVGIGTAAVSGKLLTVAGITAITSATASTGTTDGALVVTGGTGIGGALNVGGNTNLGGTLLVQSTTTLQGQLTNNGSINSSTGTTTFLDTTNSTLPTNGALVVAGGAGIGSNLNVGGNTHLIGNVTIDGTVAFTSTENSTSTTTGAVTIAGGLGVAKNTYIGGLVRIQDTTTSTSSTTGALTVSGGAGFGGPIHSGNFIVATGYLRAEGTGNAGLVLAANTDGTGNDIAYVDFNTNGILRGHLAVNDAVAGRPLEINTAVTNGVQITTNNAATVGIGTLPGSAKLTVAGTTAITSNAASTSTTTGALVVTGGTGMGGNLYVGGNHYVKSTSYTSTGNDINLNANTDTVRIRNADGTASGEFASSTTNFLFMTTTTTPPSYAMIDLVKSTGITLFNTTTNATAPGEGAVQIAGGASVAQNFFVGGDLTVGGNISSGGGSVSFDSTIDSTSTTTGALITPGGVGIGKTVYIGEDLNVAATNFSDAPTVHLFRMFGATFTDNATAQDGTVGFWSAANLGAATFEANNTGVTLTTAATLNIDGPPTNGINVTIGNAYAMRIASGRFITLDATASTSTTTGSIITAGGVGIAGATYVGGALTITNTAAAAAVGSGALIVAGGASVAKDLYVGGITNLVNTADSTSPTSGSLIVSGGAGIATQLYVGGIARFQDATASTSTTTGAVTITGGLGVGDGLHVAGDAHFYDNVVMDGVITITDTTQSTSTVTGCLVLGGGLGVAKNVYVGQLLRVQDTTGTTSRSTGAAVIAGGLGVAEHVYATSFFTSNGTIAYNFVNATTTTGVNIAKTAGDPTTTRMNLTSSAAEGGYSSDMYLYASGVPGAVLEEALRISYTPTGGIISPTTVGAGVSRDLTVYGGTVFNTDGTVNIINTTEQSGTASGNAALTVQGGVGIAKNLRVAGGKVFMTHTARNELQFNTTNNNIWMASQLGDGAGDFHIFDISGGNHIFGWYRDWMGNGSALRENRWTGEVVFQNNILGVRLSTANKPLITRGSDFTSGAYQAAGRNGLFLETNQLVAGIPSDAGNSFGISTYNADSTRANTWFTVASATGVTSITSTVASSSTTTGAFVVAGGVGIGGALNVGANVTIPSTNTYNGGTVTLTGTGANTMTGTLAIADTTPATSATSAALTVAGGAGIGGGLYVTGVGNFSGSVSVGSTLTVTGAVVFNNTDDSTACGNGALVIAGGVGIAKNLNVCGSQIISVDLDVLGDTTMTGTLTINNTTQSNAATQGALILAGGIGIAKNAYVGGNLNVVGNATVVGDLTVSGTIASVNVDTVTIQDNVLLVNSGPAGSADAGFGMKRYQAANDVGAGDVVQDTPYYTGTARAGSTATTIVLDTGASEVANHYAGDWIMITSGTGSQQVRRIVSYDATTKVATIMSTADQAAADPPIVPVEGMDWTTVPDATSVFEIFDTQYVLTYYDESADMYILGATGVNPASAPFVSVRAVIPMRLGSIYIEDTAHVDNIVEHTANAGVTIEGVLIKDNNISNLNTINGNAPDITSTVGLVDNTTARATIPGTSTTGTYLIMVRSTNTAGAMASFIAHNSGAGTAGNATRLGAARGANNEDIDVEWPAGLAPRIHHRIPIGGASGATLNYVVKVVRV